MILQIFPLSLVTKIADKNAPSRPANIRRGAAALTVKLTANLPLIAGFLIRLALVMVPLKVVPICWWLVTLPIIVERPLLVVKFTLTALHVRVLRPPLLVGRLLRALVVFLGREGLLLLLLALGGLASGPLFLLADEAGCDGALAHVRVFVDEFV